MLMYWRVDCAFSPICALSCARLKLFNSLPVPPFYQASAGFWLQISTLVPDPVYPGNIKSTNESIR